MGEFDHATITGFDLGNTPMTVSFVQVSPWRISGPLGALSTGFAVAHLRHGPNIAGSDSVLAAL